VDQFGRERVDQFGRETLDQFGRETLDQLGENPWTIIARELTTLMGDHLHGPWGLLRPPGSQ